MKTSRKYLSSAALMLALLGVNLLPFVQHGQAQADEGVDLQCILIGTDIPDSEETPVVDAEETEAADDQAEVEDADETEGDDDQNETEAADDQAEVEDADETEGDDDQNETVEPSYTGTITVDETTLTGLNETDLCAALTALATISAEQAQTIASSEGTPVIVELEAENGYLVYSVELENGDEVSVDAGDGSILNIEPADEVEGDEIDEVAPENTGITAAEAQAIAEAETGGTTLAVEFDVEGGVQIFEVELVDGRDVQVNATDGTIILIEQRDDN